MSEEHLGRTSAPEGYRLSWKDVAIGVDLVIAIVLNRYSAVMPFGLILSMVVIAVIATSIWVWQTLAGGKFGVHLRNYPVSCCLVFLVLGWAIVQGVIGLEAKLKAPPKQVQATAASTKQTEKSLPASSKVVLPPPIQERNPSLPRKKKHTVPTANGLTPVDVCPADANQISGEADISGNGGYGIVGKVCVKIGGKLYVRDNTMGGIKSDLPNANVPAKNQPGVPPEANNCPLIGSIKGLTIVDPTGKLTGVEGIQVSGFPAGCPCMPLRDLTVSGITGSAVITDSDSCVDLTNAKLTGNGGTGLERRSILPPLLPSLHPVPIRTQSVAYGFSHDDFVVAADSRSLVIGDHVQDSRGYGCKIVELSPNALFTQTGIQRDETNGWNPYDNTRSYVRGHSLNDEKSLKALILEYMASFDRELTDIKARGDAEYRQVSQHGSTAATFAVYAGAGQILLGTVDVTFNLEGKPHLHWEILSAAAPGVGSGISATGAGASVYHEIKEQKTDRSKAGRWIIQHAPSWPKLEDRRRFTTSIVELSKQWYPKIVDGPIDQAVLDQKGIHWLSRNRNCQSL